MELAVKPCIGGTGPERPGDVTVISLVRELLHGSAEAGNEPLSPVATYPQAWSSRPQALAYLVLLRMEVAAFHPVAWHYDSCRLAPTIVHKQRTRLCGPVRHLTVPGR